MAWPQQAIDSTGRTAQRFPPSTAQVLVAGTAIAPSGNFLPISAASAITLTGTPTITAGFSGQEITIINEGSFAITLQDQSVLANSGLRLLGGRNLLLLQYRALKLIYDATLSAWCHIAGATTRTRAIHLSPDLATAALWNNQDTHGSIDSGNNINFHFHAADGADTFPGFNGVPCPTDDTAVTAANWVVKVMWSSTAAGNNVFMGANVASLKDTDTVNQICLAFTGVATAAPAVANTATVTSTPFTLIPTQGSLIAVFFAFQRTSGSDTNTGQVSIYGAWLEYLADS